VQNFVEPNAALPLGLRVSSAEEQSLAAAQKVRWVVFTKYFLEFWWEGGDEGQELWLKNRLALFRKHCIPGMLAQQKQLSCWYVFAEEYLHEALAAELTPLFPSDKLRFITAESIEGFQANVSEIIESLRVALADDEYLLSSRLDNDDGLSLDYYLVAASIISAAGEKVDGHVISFPMGVQLDAKSDLMRIYPFTDNHFLSSIHSVRSKAVPNCLSFNHSHLFTLLPGTLVFNTRHPMWMEVHHDGNLRNRGIDGIVMNTSAAARRFATGNRAAPKAPGQVPPLNPPAQQRKAHMAAGTRRELVETVRGAIARSGAMKPGIFGDVYASVLSRVECHSIFEVGIHQGGSVRLWRELLGPRARIACMDINPDCCRNAKQTANDVFQGSQVDPDLLQRIGTTAGPFDVIVDDGSHQNPHMIFTLEQMFAFVRPGGAYVIEDMFTSYWPRYRGGLGKSDALMEYLKRELDRLYAGFIDEKYKAHFLDQPIPELEAGVMTRQVESVEFFGAGIVVIHKK
jgi:hypothetical protein